MNIFLTAVAQVSLLTVIQEAPPNLPGKATVQTSETVISFACSGVLTHVAVVFWQVQPLLPPLSLAVPSQFLEQWLVSPVDSELGVVGYVHLPRLRYYLQFILFSKMWPGT